MLPLHDTFLLSKSSDGACATHAFVEVRVDGSVERGTYFVKLIVCTKEWFTNLQHQVEN